MPTVFKIHWKTIKEVKGKEGSQAGDMPIVFKIPWKSIKEVKGIKRVHKLGTRPPFLKFIGKPLRS